MWLRAFQIARAGTNVEPGLAQITDLEDVRLVLGRGELTYVAADQKWTLDATDSLRLQVHLSEQTTPEMTFLLLLTPWESEHPNPELLAHDRLESSAGLVAAVLGENAVYARVFENKIGLNEVRTEGVGPVVRVPSASTPRLDGSALEELRLLDAAIASQDASARERGRLSLRWFRAATLDSGVDAFLKYWIALETLAMPDTTDIREIKRLLASAYSSPSGTDPFQIGRLFGLRSRIVHDGLRMGITAAVESYLRAIYTDLLSAAVGRPCPHRAAAAQADGQVVIDGC